VTLLLALDTATDRATLALDDGHMIAERAIPERRLLSSTIERETAVLLREAHAAPGDLGGLVVADGPGGFTGLRIGVAFAKGMARALGIPMIAVPSMAGAAWTAACGSADVEVRYDALRGEVFRAVYRITPPEVRTLVPPSLASRDLPWADGVRRGSETEAAASALLAVVRTGFAGPVADLASWEPAYGRPAEAEVRRLAQSGGR
jgi:tRNA threonylcarbamoyladenosine biosynthesis protein TsaB